MVQTRQHQATPEQEKFLKDLKDQMPADMPDQQILAIVSQFLGQLIALQDSRKMTPEAVMQVVNENIQIGNAAAVLTLQEPEGHS